MSSFASLRNKYKIDDQTGLPTPPEGHRWRFRKMSRVHDQIELLKGNRFFPSVVEWTVVSKADFTEELLIGRAYHLLRRFEERVPVPARVNTRKYYGTYPPKSLPPKTE